MSLATLNMAGLRGFVFLFALFAGSLPSALAAAQTRKPRQPQPINKLAQLHEEYINATKEYKASLTKLATSYDRDVIRAKEHLAQSQALFAEGLISKNQLTAAEGALAAANDKVTETARLVANADSQIADTLLEAQADSRVTKTRLGKGSLIRTSSYVRYSGTGGWFLSEAWKVQRFFLDSFKRPLPVGVFGQGAIHDRWRLDHRNAMDISLHPDGAEGQALMNFLRAQGVPFLAFRGAIPGTATGPHIHVGLPSHRY